MWTLVVSMFLMAQAGEGARATAGAVSGEIRTAEGPARPAGVRVSGRMSGLPPGTPAGVQRVTMFPTDGATGRTFVEASVLSDGTFEFLRVLPGAYMVNPAPNRMSDRGASFRVNNKDIAIEVSTSPLILGHVTVDDGGKLPVEMTSTAAATASVPFAAVQLVAFRTIQLRPPHSGTDVMSTGAAVRPDGYFLFPSDAGEYQFEATLLPFGYYLKSATFETTSNQIQITLTKARPAWEPVGFKVSGRIIDPGAAVPGLRKTPRWVTLRQQRLGPSGLDVEQRIGQAVIRDDGTFEVLNVPPGRSTLRVSSPGEENVALVFLDIADRDVDVELSITTSQERTSPPATAPETAPPDPSATIFVVPE